MEAQPERYVPLRKTLMIPNISGSARGAKAPILNNEVYNTIEGTDNVKYARIIMSALKEK